MMGQQQSTGFSYRVLQSEDAPVYRRVRLESLQRHPECFGSSFEQQYLQPKLFFEEQIEGQSDEHIMLGAFYGEQLIGLCGLIAIENNQLLLVQMYVQDNFQGRGVASALLVKAKSLLSQSGRTSITLTVFEDNLAAQHLYQKAGFIMLEKVSHEWVMQYSL